MEKSVDLNQLELTVKEELKKNENITVEISGLAESAYGPLVDAFNEKDYEVRGIVNVLRTGNKGKMVEDYVLHIRRNF